MIRKWIEIMFCVGAPVFSAAVVAAPGPAGAGVARLSQLGQVQVFPVEVEAVSVPRPLESVPGSVPVSGTGPSSGMKAGGPEATAGGVSGAQGEDATITPDIPPDWFWTQEDGLSIRSVQYAQRYRLSRHSPGLMGAIQPVSPGTSNGRWLAVPGESGWIFGVRDWRTRLENGPEVRLGRSEIEAPEWNEVVPLGGISLSQSFFAAGEGGARWQYSLAAGALDQSPAGSPELEFGPFAGSLALKYDHGPSLSLESQAEAAPDLVMAGVTGAYDLGAFGR